MVHACKSKLGVYMKTKTSGNIVASATILITCLSVSFNVPAQLEEIIVTAQKRSENIMTVPISITAISGESLLDAGVRTTDDLQAVVPAASFRKQISAFVPFIRGIGSQNTAIGTEASVAMYVDGIYQSLPVSNAIGFNNIERIEVLKGPQGTLFGRNATGGAINIFTKDPEHESSGTLKLGYGNYETFNVDFFGTTGLTEDLAVNAAVQYEDQGEGYFNDTINDTDVSKKDGYSARVKLLWTPGENTAVRLSASFEDTEGGVGGQRVISSGTNVLGNMPLAGNKQIQQNYTYGTNTGSEFEGADLELESRAVTLRIDHDIGNHSLVSITGWLDQDSFYIVDQDVGPLPGIDADLTHRNKQVSQEIQVLSNYDGRFNWIAGYYFLNAEHDYDPLRLKGIFFLPLDFIDIRNTAETTSHAGFVEGNYKFTDATKLTVGFRYTEDKKELRGRTDYGAGGFIANSVPYSGSKTWSEPTWRAVLDHWITDDVMAYASHTRGFKAGSFNGVVTSGVLGAPVNPETMDGYEIGFKGQFLNDSFALTGAVYYYEIDDLQYSQQIVGGSIQRNAAEAEVKGFELSGQVVMTGGFSLSGGLAYTDAEFVDFPNGLATIPNPAGVGNIPDEDVPGQGKDLTGNTVPRTSDWTLNLALGHEWVLDNNAGAVNSTLTYYYNDGHPWEADNRVREDSYSLVNAKIGYTNPTGRYTVEIWGKNLTEEEYSSYATSSLLQDATTPSVPRTYGVSLTVSF